MGKMTANNPNLDLVNINAYMKYGQILSISSQDIERKQNSDQSRAISVTNMQKMMYKNDGWHDGWADGQSKSSKAPLLQSLAIITTAKFVLKGAKPV